MWSYQDDNGNSHSHISATEIRQKIQAGSIKPHTLVRSLQFPEWQHASETLFFNATSTLVPNKTEIKDLQINFTPSSPPITSPYTPYIPQLIFAVNLILALLPISYITFKTSKQMQKVSSKELKLIQNQEQIQDFNNTKERFAQADATFAIAETNLVNSHYTKEESKIILQELKEDSLFWKNRLRSFNNTKEDANLPLALHQEKEQLDRLKKSSWIYFISLLIPFAYCIKDYFTVAYITAEKPFNLVLGILHSIPGTHLLIYPVISAMWNMEGSQRKNSFILNLPLSVAATVCLGLSFYLFSDKTTLSFISFIISCLLWLILHCRQLQMLTYLKNRKWKLSNY